MKLLQLKYFQTICKYNNITRASNELHVSQPSLSNVIRDLDEFKKISDVIVANRYSDDIKDVLDKVYTRDLYFRD